jgi:hypothetical protein
VDPDSQQNGTVASTPLPAFNRNSLCQAAMRVQKNNDPVYKGTASGVPRSFFRGGGGGVTPGIFSGGSINSVEEKLVAK